MIAKALIRTMKDYGIPIKNNAVIENYVNHAIKDDRFKFITKNGQSIGFVMWELLWLEEGLDIYVSYLVILDKFKGKFNLKELTTFWKKEYNGVHKFIWHNHKKEQRKEFLQLN